jgi:hypothetical protein
MRAIRVVGILVGATAAVAGVAGPAVAATPGPPRTVVSLKARVDAKAAHITAKLQALRVRIAGKPQLVAARATLQADIVKTLVDTAAWRRRVDAATTKAGIRAADTAHQIVKADLAKLHRDLAAAKVHN